MSSSSSSPSLSESFGGASPAGPLPMTATRRLQLTSLGLALDVVTLRDLHNRSQESDVEDCYEDGVWIAGAWMGCVWTVDVGMGDMWMGRRGIAPCGQDLRGLVG
ncbi:hypothetical protein F2Q70_00004674 [Brassica cretica]|uniref:Uncharacterized protein n=1 Tax=Brassica cretica TaxID=69181 RepID=A0A8S9IJS3_BRACR|nr:hypothetical protein F2Q70_00004674 [Brassica cretica]